MGQALMITHVADKVAPSGGFQVEDVADSSTTALPWRAMIHREGSTFSVPGSGTSLLDGGVTTGYTSSSLPSSSGDQSDFGGAAAPCLSPARLRSRTCSR
jgi:hypothetical protein